MFNNMMPYNSNPSTAFNNCIQQTCPLLYKDKIYKCSTSALLKDTLARFKNPNPESWKHYMDDGISLNSSNNDISKFILNFGKSNKICAQCPTASNNNGGIPHNETTIKLK